MKYFPYGGEKTMKELKILGENDTQKYKKKYERKLSLKPQDVLDDLNDAFQAIAKNPNIYTMQKHLKAIAIFIILVSLLGILSLYLL